MEMMVRMKFPARRSRLLAGPLILLLGSFVLAMRNTKHGSGLGRWRWLVERTFAWLNQFRRLRVRYEKRPDMHLALLTLACILICWKFLQTQPRWLRD